MKNCHSKSFFNHGTFFALFVLSLALFIGIAGTPLQAREWTVTVASDDVTDPGSLRYAVENAVSGDVISFDLEYPAVITLNEQIVVSKDLTIHGPGANPVYDPGTLPGEINTGDPVLNSGNYPNLLTISGGNACRVFVVGDPFYKHTNTIYGLTVADGYAVNGGGIYTNANLILENVTLLNNRAIVGGGMFDRGGYALARVTDCTFIGNSADENGGGMYTDFSQMPVRGCLFLNNTAGIGGGGMNNRSSLSLAVTNSTFTGNSASFGGGVANNEGLLTVTNCTFTGNTATNYGGGISVSMSMSTVTNCIFWGDTGGEIHGTRSGCTYCVISDDNLGDYGDNNINTDPLLQDLADNGGPTKTFALGLGSPAIDAGITMDGVSLDQRGATRPQGVSFDIGAYELKCYTITSACSDGGCILPESADVFEGASIDFGMYSESDDRLCGVYVDGEPVSYDETDNTYTFHNVSGNHVISADFQPLVDETAGRNLDGCSISALPGMALLLAVPMVFLTGKR